MKLPGELASELETAEPGQWGSSELEPDETEVRTGTSTLGSIVGLAKCPTLGAGYEGGYDEVRSEVGSCREPEPLACHTMRTLCSRSSLLE